MGSWYSIGIVLGLAVGGGVIAAGALARSLAGMMVGAVAERYAHEHETRFAGRTIEWTLNLNEPSLQTSAD